MDEAMGRFGADHAARRHRDDTMHAGALATAGIGTALGVIAPQWKMTQAPRAGS